MDVRGAAVYLGMTEQALYTGASRGEIPVRHRGRKLVFDKVALDSYIEQLEGVTVDGAIARLSTLPRLRPFFKTA